MLKRKGQKQKRKIQSTFKKKMKGNLGKERRHLDQCYTATFDYICTEIK